MSASDRVDPAELAAWTAANVRAGRAYYRQPNSADRAKRVCSACGAGMTEDRPLCVRCAPRGRA